MSVLEDLQRWYASHCGESWQEEFGVEIRTISNPGWMVSIDLTGTNLEGRSYPTFERTIDDDHDWITCRVEKGKFLGFGDPAKLKEIIDRFLIWARASNEHWLLPPPPPTPEEQQRTDDEQFWLSLGEEVGSDTCTTAGCSRKRIPLSVKCRTHHFEMVKGRPPPPTNAR